MISPIAGHMPHLIGYHLSVLFACTILAGGGMLYAFSTNGWMVSAARFLMGVFDGCAYVFSYSYISQIGSEVEVKRNVGNELERSKKKASNCLSKSDNTFKDKLFTINLLIKSVMHPVVFGKDLKF